MLAFLLCTFSNPVSAYSDLSVHYSPHRNLTPNEAGSVFAREALQSTRAGQSSFLIESKGLRLARKALVITDQYTSDRNTNLPLFCSLDS